jgi:peptide deformylase
MHQIYQLADEAQGKVLRTPPQPYVFADHAPAETRALVDRMKRAMHAAQGIGLSANQVGIPWQVFVGQIASAQGKPKFYAIFNPKVTWQSEDVSPFEEGCLSIPKVYGMVERSEKIVLEGQDKSGKPVKIKAWGLLARMFQHEVDHLNGAVFTDKAKNVRPVIE